MKINELYQQRRPDGHFFDADSMRFFRSRCIGDYRMMDNGTAVFITSEQFKPSRGPAEPRRYTVRLLDPNGAMAQYGPFNERSRQAAIRDLDRAFNHQVTAGEVQAGGLAVGCVRDAKASWEAAGGSIDAITRKHRKNANHWAEKAGYRLQWHCIHPSFIRISDGREFSLAGFAERIAAE